MDDATFVRPRAAGILFTFLLLAAAVTAQGPCYDFGSLPRPLQFEAGPRLLDCAGWVSWPHWHLLTPAHREPAPHPGHNPGDARELSRVLVAYRCTGFLLVPIAVLRVRRMGYVIDQPEIACSPTITS